MKNFKLFLISILLSVISPLFYGCLDENADENISISNLTVQASISEGRFAQVYLTNAIPFSGTIDSLEIARAVESKAKITVTDINGEQDILTLKRDNSKYPFLFYEGSLIQGEIGNEYKIEIELAGELLSSVSNIPTAPSIENIEFVEDFEEELANKEFRDLKLTLNRNNDEIEYYKFKIRSDEYDSNFQQTDPYIINTENINTNSFSFLLQHSVFNEEQEKFENKFIVGNEFVLQVISITKEEYDFLKAIGGDETALLDGFSFNEQVPSNIKGRAFGYWSGENTTTILFTVQ